MLKIKLARFGKNKQPHYRIVVNEARDKRDGSYVAALGHYAPTQQPKLLEINLVEYQAWIGKGAQPTETVAALAKRFESGNPFPARKAKLSKKAKAKQAAAATETAKPKEEPTPIVEAAPTAEAKPEVAPEVAPEKAEPTPSAS